MADITNPQIVTFSNTRVRALADKTTALYYALLSFQNDYTAAGMSALITAAGASNNIGDGSDIDGRQRITGTQIINLKAAVDVMITSLGTSLVSGVGSTVATIVGGIQVNGSPR